MFARDIQETGTNEATRQQRDGVCSRFFPFLLFLNDRHLFLYFMEEMCGRVKYLIDVWKSIKF